MKIGDYVIYTRFGMKEDFKAGEVIKIINKDNILGGGVYIMKLVYVHGITIKGGDGTQQLSLNAPVIVTTKEGWPREVIKGLFK